MGAPTDATAGEAGAGVANLSGQGGDEGTGGVDPGTDPVDPGTDPELCRVSDFAREPCTGVVTFPDPALEAAVRAYLGIPSDQLDGAALSYVWSLTIDESDLSSLEGVQCLVNLEKIFLNHTGVSDIAPLSDLPRLQAVTIQNSAVTAPVLNGLPGALLELSGNPVADWSGLRGFLGSSFFMASSNLDEIPPLEGLPCLTVLGVHGNAIRDVSRAARFPHLQVLNLSGNPINDVSPLGEAFELENLTLIETPVADVSPLSGLPHLQELWLTRTQLPAPVLHDLPALARLHLEESGVVDASGLDLNGGALFFDGNPMTDLASLSGSGISALFFGGAQIANVNGLDDLPLLDHVYLNGPNLVDVSALANLPSLRTIEVYSSPLANIDGLSGMPNLVDLIVGGNHLTSVSLSNLPKLERMDLNQNDIGSLTLSGMPSLRQLWVVGNLLTDTSGIANLPALNLLWLADNQIPTPRLASLPSLAELFLQNAGVVSTSGLVALPSIDYLDLGDNWITDIDPLDDTSEGATLAHGDVVVLDGNVLCDGEQKQHMQNLAARGVYVSFTRGRTSEGVSCN